MSLSESHIQDFHKVFNKLIAAVHSAIIGQIEPVWLMIVAFFAKGHALIEGNPGTGKTTMAKAFANAIGLEFVRIQGTPDLMPADIIGHEIFNPNTGKFEEREGPFLKGNIILLDEINRMTPKTQAATLEALQESTVTFAGKKHDVLQPNMVLATMNPIEQEGTYPLPEAQIDRFLVKILMERPTAEQYAQITEIPGQDITDEKLAKIERVFNDAMEISKYQDMVDEVELGAYAQTIGSIVEATCPDGFRLNSDIEPQAPRDYLRYGGSPRGAQALTRLAKVAALTEGSPFVKREHLQKILQPALRHRILLRYEYAMRTTPDDLLMDIFERMVRR